VIIGDHDGFRQRLGDKLAEVVGQGEDNLEPLFFGVVPAVTGNPHGSLYLPEPPRSRIGMVLHRPLLDLLRVEDDHPPGFVLFPGLFILGVL
jgi:hypothetical protein